MSREELKKLTKSQIKGHWTTPVLLTLVYTVLMILVSSFQEYAYSSVMNIMAFIVVSAIGVWATIGIPNFYLEFIKKDGKAEFKDILVSSNKLLKSLIYTIVISLISIVIGIVSVFMYTGILVGGFFSFDSLTIMATLASIIIILISVAFIIFSFAIAQTPYIILEKEDLGVFSAMKLSIEMMKGNKWKYFVLELSFLGWGILSVITLGIGFLWLIPYISLATTNFYKDISINIK
ncbi:MAG: DUF975 family protein [Romboutsia sp.]